MAGRDGTSVQPNRSGKIPNSDAPRYKYPPPNSNTNNRSLSSSNQQQYRYIQKNKNISDQNMDLDIVPRTPDTQNQQMLQRLRKNLHSDFDNNMDTEENTTMKQIEDHIV